MASVMQAIQQAAYERKMLQITYIDKKGKPTIRSVEPYELKGDGLYAHCTVRNDIRFFKLSNIQSAVVHFQTFAPRHPIKI